MTDGTPPESLDTGEANESIIGARSRRAVVAAGAGIVAGCLESADVEPTDSNLATTEQPTPNPTATPNNPADRIRNRAGIPDEQHVGIRTDADPGPQTVDELERDEPITIESSDAAETAADRGSGTEGDPYVIEDRAVVDDEAAPAALLVDGTEAFHLSVSNCELPGLADAAIAIRGPVNVAIEDCRLTGTDEGSHLIDHDGSGSVSLERTVLDGGADGVRLHSGTVSARDCRWAEDEATFSGQGITVPPTTSADTTIDIQYCDFTAPSSATAIGCGGSGHHSVRLENTLIRDCTRGLHATPGADVSGMLVRYCRFADAERQHVSLGGANSASDVEIAHSSFDENGAGYRLVVFFSSSGEAVRDSRVHHCKFTKTRGEKQASNEALESFNGRNIEFDHNWVTACPEDAYEHVGAITGCSVHHSVAEDTAGQIVDFFSAAKEPGETDKMKDDTQSEIHHIYGDCEDNGVIITDCGGVEIEHVQVTAAKYGVKLDHRNAPDYGNPNNVHLRGPLPKDDDVGFSYAIDIDEGCGENITVEGIGPETSVQDGRTSDDG